MKGLRTDLPWLHAGKMQPLPDSALWGSPAPEHLLAVRVRPCCVTLFSHHRGGVWTQPAKGSAQCHSLTTQYSDTEPSGR